MGKQLTYGPLVDRLSELVNEEHVCGCDQDSCDINAAYSNGYALWAVYLFDSCGAASEEFCRLFKLLPKRRFKKESEAERKAFVKDVEHDQCPHCNAVVWHNGDHGDEIHCDSCGKTFEQTTETKGTGNE